MGKRKRIVYSLIGLAVAALILFPIVWMLPGAFKPKSELFALPNHFLPQNATMQNFQTVFELDTNGFNFVRSLGVTVIVAVLAMLLSLLVNTMAGYVFARFRFPGKKFLWLYFLFTMFTPGITILLTSIRVVNFLNMTDTIWVLILPAASNAYNIFFFRQFYLGIPGSLEEAAMIDGAGRFQIFWKIFVPMSSTPMVVIGVGVFMSNYNSFLWPTLTIVNNPELQQIMQGIRMLSSSYAGQFGVVIAATLLSLIVPILVFAIFQKWIMEGVALTGIK